MVLSVIVPGLGQIYNQEVKKGLVIFGSCLSLGLLTYWISGFNKFSTALALVLIWISALTDAYKVAATAGEPSDFYYRETLCRRHVIARRSPGAAIAVAKSTFFMAARWIWTVIVVAAALLFIATPYLMRLLIR